MSLHLVCSPMGGGLRPCQQILDEGVRMENALAYINKGLMMALKVDAHGVDIPKLFLFFISDYLDK
jgi:hypothetical protein